MSDQRVQLKIRQMGHSSLMRIVYDGLIYLWMLQELLDQFPPSDGYYYTMHPPYNIVLDGGYTPITDTGRMAFPRTN